MNLKGGKDMFKLYVNGRLLRASTDIYILVEYVNAYQFNNWVITSQ